jgi:Xaa-Pro dipeptidase
VTYDIERDTLILWIPYVEPRQVLWYGSTPSPKECLGRSDVDDVRYIDRINDYISDLLRYGSTDTLYVLHPYQIPGIQDGRGFRIDSSKLLLRMDAARVIKSDYEVAMIRRANKVSSAAHREIARRLRKLKNEREIEAIFRASCTAAGAPAQAYPIIAGSGTNAATLHYDDNNQDLAGKQLLVLDAGCEWDCYASDITRTLPLDGKFSPEAAEIHALVTHMQEKCIASVKPGAVYYQIHLKACQIALMGLMRLGILRGGTVGEIWNAGTVAAFFPHGLGHHVGLETHDVTGRQRLLFDCEAKTTGKRTRIRKRLFVSPEMEGPPPPYKGRQILEPNMIVTIEPGM